MDQSKRLDEVIRGIAITDRRGRFDAEIAGITADSRAVHPGDLFVAVRGGKVDGHAFIRQALAAGAAGVIGESWPREIDSNGTRPAVVLVPNSRRALALAAANYYGQPSKKLHVAGVTGTNGKTTVTYLLESIIRAASKRVGVIGTVDCRYGQKSEPIDHTTPDPVFLHEKLREMLDAKVTHVVMEVSSHALDQQRVAGIHFKVAGFTNLTQDHLDYHRSMDAYFEAKARLFSEVLRKSRARGRMAVVNVDDPRGPQILERWGGKALSVSIDPKSGADIVALDSSHSLDGLRATVRSSKGVWELETALIGKHNLQNVLVALGMALAMGFSKARIMRGLDALERVPGRLERVPGDPAKSVFVDYAHTPDALNRAIAALRPLVSGRVVVVFGCGGDRDKAKRPLMGKAVADGADLAIITNDNPRSENPTEIAMAIEKGMLDAGWKRQGARPEPMSFAVELDRRAAIRRGIDLLRPDDVLLIAGKGHETYQIVGKRKMRFDDREEARRILSGMPPPPPMAFDDATSEVEVAQVEESVEIADSLEILSEESARPAPTTESVAAEAIVDAVDLEPDIVGELEEEEAELVEVIEEAEDADAVEVIEAEEDPPPGDGKT
jgi:UDP-N-acetylmuramoyl-L-alanyl-D-glutamate--2,6-diaminopimelate ligase